MVAVNLRPYQEEAIAAVEGKWASGESATLLVCATGTGKTTIFGEIAHRRIEDGERVLVLAHRDELIRQAARRLELICGIEPGIEKADERWGGEPLCVASVQTLRGERLSRFSPETFDTVIIDEAHHSVSASYRAIIDHMGGKLLGVTATADRADRQGLAQVYDSVAYEYSLARAVQEGYLCRIVAECLPLEMDLSGVKVSHGDYQASDLGSAIEPYLAQIARTMREECKGRRTVAFLPLVSTAEKFADELRSVGMSAVCVSGYDPDQDRKDKLAAFERGEIDVICNAMLLTEGWDCPSVDCIVVLRPTKSRPLFTQMVGRGTRLSPETGKDHLLLLDFLWMTDKHDLCRPASLLGTRGEVARRMQEIAEDGGEADLLDLEQIAENEVARQREEALAKQLETMRHRRKKLVDPLQFAASIMNLDLMDYRPTFAWEQHAASDAQIDVIERAGIDASGLSKGQASQLVSAIMARNSQGLATAKQIRCLEKAGFLHVGTWSREDASDVIGKLAACQWKPFLLTKKHGIVPAKYVPKAEGGAA